MKGIDAIGIDLSPAQVTGAQSRWGQLPGARHLQGDALAFLASADEQWDAIYSIWLLHNHGFVDIHARGWPTAPVCRGSPCDVGIRPQFSSGSAG